MPEPASATAFPQIGFVRLPPGRAKNDGDSPPRQRRHVVHDGVRRGEIKRDIDVVPPWIVNRAGTRWRHRIDNAGDLTVELRRQLSHQLPHFSVTD
jgi:hypothetical protein